MTRGFGRFLRRNTIALLALFLALGGTSYAAATLISGSQIKPHTIAKNRLTNKAIKQLKGNRGARGPAGAPGAPGAQGIQGIQGIQGPAGPGARWAVVAPDGTVVLQSGSITVTHISAGAYRVDFGADVSHALLLAEPATANDLNFRGTTIAGPCAPPAGSATLIPCSPTGSVNWVAVFTMNSGETALEDHSFYVSEIGPTGASPSGSTSSSSRSGPLSGN